MLTCNHVRAMMSEALDGVLADDERDRVNGHVQTCPACRDHWQSMQHLSALFAAAGNATPPAGFTGRLMSRLHDQNAPALATRTARGHTPAAAWASAAIGIAVAWAALCALALRLAAASAPASSLVGLSMRVSTAAFQAASAIDSIIAIPLHLVGSVPAPALVLLVLWVVAGTLALGLTVGSLVAAYPATAE